MRKFLVRHWFLVGLAVAVVTGFAFAEPLSALPDVWVLRNGIVVVVLFLMSFPLALGDLQRAVRRPGGAVLATLVNYGALPLIAWVASLLSSGDLAIGINVMAAIPCTLASAAVWTRRAGGNDSTALIVTLVTNAFCFLVTPFWLYWTTGSHITISLGIPTDGRGLSLLEMMIKLFFLVVLPMMAGQFARAIPVAGKWATKNKKVLSNVAQAGILAMVMLGCISCGLKLRALPTDQMPHLGSFATMIVLVLAVHLTALGLGVGVARQLKFPRAEEIAVAFAGSQKTLMIGLALVTEFYPSHPLAILPMVAYHVGQLFIDTVVADRYLSVHAAESNQTPSPPAAIKGEQSSLGPP